MTGHRFRRIDGFIRKLRGERAIPSLVERFERAISRLRELYFGGELPPDVLTLAELIPALTSWGERDLAVELGGRLVEMQDSSGWWTDPGTGSVSVIGTCSATASIAHLAARHPEFRGSASRACDRILALFNDRLRQFRPEGEKYLEELAAVALCLKRGAEMPGGGRYGRSVEKAVELLRTMVRDPACDPVGEFPSEVVPRILDLGLQDTVRDALRCKGREEFDPDSTRSRAGETAEVFRRAAIYGKLGDRSRADGLFRLGCALQGRSGGFPAVFGTAGKISPDKESLPALTHFLNSLSWKIRNHFDAEVDHLPRTIGRTDGRYQLVEREIISRGARKVLEVGCGSGRFINLLKREHPGVDVTGLDISEKMLGALAPTVRKIRGTCLDMPVDNGDYDLVFAVETIEHALNIRAAIREMSRVVAPGGGIVIIDKNRAKTGVLPMEEWEQWFDERRVGRLLKDEGFRVATIHSVPYSEGPMIENLFLGWVGTKTGSGNQGD